MALNFGQSLQTALHVTATRQADAKISFISARYCYDATTPRAMSKSGNSSHDFHSNVNVNVPRNQDVDSSDASMMLIASSNNYWIAQKPAHYLNPIDIRSWSTQAEASGGSAAKGVR